MRSPAFVTDRLVLLGAVVALSAACKGRAAQQEVVVFYAASLARSFVHVQEELQRLHPELRLRLEVSGSQVAARKVAQMSMRADAVVTADVAVIDSILIPEHARWSIRFATNEIVVAHRSHSRYTESITAETWPSILQRGDVRLGCVDPDLAPIGYRTRLVWMLAEAHYGLTGLDGRLSRRCAAEHTMPHEGEVLQLLSARAVDYAMMYRSTAEEHNLKMTRLPASINLGHIDRADQYARAAVPVRMGGAAGKLAVVGRPILYGVTVPSSAPNRAGGEKLVGFLLSEAGQRILKQSGFRPVTPALAKGLEAVPASLRPHLQPVADRAGGTHPRRSVTGQGSPGP